MAKDGRTEEATPRKRRLEREKGNLPRSKEMTAFLSLLAFSLIVFIFGSKFVSSVVELAELCFNMMTTDVPASTFIVEGFKRVFYILLPIFVIGTVGHAVDYFLQVGFLFSFKIMKPNFKKLVNYKQYFTDLFSRKKAIDLVRNFALLIIFSVIAYYVLRGQVSLLASGVWLSWQQSITNIMSVYKTTLAALVFVLFVIALVDLFYQKWEHAQKIKMKKEEVRDEAKETEGSPDVKRRRKELMYALLQRDMAVTVPDSTVIINNPTHISVALRYKRGKDEFPVVLAKGEEELALYIRKIAKENKIPMVENKPLARALYFNVDVNNTIPPEMFEAVAAVLRELIEKKEIEI